MSDFRPVLADSNVFLNCQDCFQLRHDEYFSVENMDDEELRYAIMDDILAVTMWERHHQAHLSFGFNRLFQFIPQHTHLRVREQMNHPDVYNLLDLDLLARSGELRLRKDHAVLQAAMDYCGVWYAGFKAAESTIGFCDITLEKYGSLENLATSITMEHVASLESTTAVN